MKILYGIQPTGKLHIGNYLGGIKRAIELQENNEVIFLIAQYHAWTTTSQTFESSLRLELMNLGVKTIISQDYNNLELAWSIMCSTPVAELQRMTQWKTKGKGNAGLLTYPCLMAADIILINPDYVLVGEDQLQHLEFCRRHSKNFGLKVKPLLTETPRIMSVKDPTKKMSKSLGDEHCLYLGEDNTKKIMKAPTTIEGIKNLKQIARGLGINYDETNNNQSKKEIIKVISTIK